MPSNVDRSRRKTVHFTVEKVPNVQSTTEQNINHGIENPSAVTTQSQPICTVVNSVKLPIMSAPALNPSENIQVVSTSQMKPAIKFGELEEMLKASREELHESELKFHEMVANVNTADRLIFENISLLEHLHSHLEHLRSDSKAVANDLTKTFSELNVYEDAVCNLEKRLGAEIVPPIDKEQARKETLYNFMIKLNININYLVDQLTEVICQNNAPLSGSNLTNPVHQIGSILNHNYETLMYIENALLESKVRMDRISCFHKEFFR